MNENEQVDKMMGETDPGKIFEISPTTEELAMFAHLEGMEAVHNEIARNLGMFKEQIVASKNEFYIHLNNKYGIERPSMMCFDPVDKVIRSVFHGNHQTRIITVGTVLFRRMVADKMFEIIKTMTAYFKTENKR